MFSQSQRDSLFQRIFYVDLRTLGLFRIALATLLICDIIERLIHVRLYYTDLGIMPVEGIDDVFGQSIRWTSLHYHTGSSVALQSGMLIISLAFALSMLVGYRTKLSTVITWLLIVSLNRRVPVMCSGGDETIRLMLFWSFFLPTGAWFSVDRWTKRRQGQLLEASNRFASMGSAAILLQVCFVYWFTTILKLDPVWLGGSAVQIALELDFNTRPLGLWLASHTTVTKLMTYATLFAEAFMPFVALSPWHNATCRGFAILVMWGLHAGIAILMSIGIFPFASIVSWIVFIPSEFWDWLFVRLGHGSHEEALSDVDLEPASTQQPWQFERSRFVSVVVALLLLLVTAYNILGLNQLKQRGVRIPRLMELVACGLRIDQRWGMYAPTPRVSDGWLVMPAILKDQSKIDIFTTKPFTYDKPASTAYLFPTPRLKKLLMTYRGEQTAPAWRWFAKYYAAEWNNRQSDAKRRIQKVQILYVGELSHNGDRFIWAYVEYNPETDEFIPLKMPIDP